MEVLLRAIDYAKLGWRVFPTHSVRDGTCTCGNAVCQSPGKHPIANLTPNGFHSATVNTTTIRGWYSKDPWANVAIVTGRESGILVLDIDIKHNEGKYGDETIQALEKTHGPLPSTVEAITGSKGRHIFFQYPDDVGRLRSGAGTLGADVDSRGDGGYVIAPPSRNIRGPYFWDNDPLDGVVIAEAPRWVCQALVPDERHELDTATIAEALNHASEDERMLRCRAYLQAVPPAVEGEGGDSHTYRTATLGADFGLSPDKFWPLIVEWNSTCVPPWDEEDLRRKMKNAYKYRSYPVGEKIGPIDGIDISGIVNAVRPTPKLKHLSEAPAHLLRPPGVLGTITDYVLETSIRPQPIFAVMAAISLGGLVMGRKYQTETGLRTNQYLICMGATGCGKEGGRRAIRQILESAGLVSLLGGEPASGQGLLARASKTPNVLFLQDEFGDFLGGITSRRASEHKAAVLTNFVKLHSTAQSVYQGTEYAKQDGQGSRPRIDIDYPCVHLYGTSVADSVYEALSSRQVVSGCLNRMLMVETTIRRPDRRRPGNLDVPEAIIDWIKTVYAPDTGTLEGVNPSTPVTLYEDPGAAEVLREMAAIIDEEVERNADTGLDALWDRSWEHAAKLAAVAALGDNPHAREIGQKHAQWAVDFVLYAVRQMVGVVDQKVSDTETEAIVKRLAGHIREAGTIAKGALTRKNQRVDRRAREDALKTLLESGQVTMETRGKRLVYVWVG